MLYRNLFAHDLFAELSRLQRGTQGISENSPAIRGLGRGGFPALNIGTTPSSVEIYAFTPGVDPASVEINLDRGVLTIAGERAAATPAPEEGQGKRQMTHLEERFAGRFHRVVSLPEDIDPQAVTAESRDGLLRISIQRKAAAQPRRITVQ